MLVQQGEAYICFIVSGLTMEGQSERTGFSKLVVIMLMIHGIILFMMAIPFRLIPEYRIAIQGIFPDPLTILPWNFVTGLIIWLRPQAEHTRYYILAAIFYDIFAMVWVFFEEFAWLMSDIRIIFSLVYFSPVIPLLFYVLTTTFIKEDITEAQFDVFIHEEIMKHPSIEEGLDYVLDYIADPQWKFEDGYREDFLEYLSKRDDELGQLARDRLNPFD
jgi:hypothetical protein